MLVELSIRNLAVIEEVHMTFGEGFHVLTGETGAGKSIVIDALSLIVGGRSSVDLVRYGAKKAEVETLFDLEEDHPVWGILERRGIEANTQEHLLIRREVTVQGKSTSRINGQLVNLTMLREVGEWLVNIHGQHEHQSLLKVDQHMPLLDLYGSDEILKPKQAYLLAYKAYNDIIKQVTELQMSTQRSLQMMDLYRFQVEEISAAHLKIEEDESLSQEQQKLANAERLVEAVSNSYDVIYGQEKGLDAIGQAVVQLEAIVTYDSHALGPLLEQIQSAYFQLEDAAHELRNYRDQIEFNPARLDEIERRLDLIASLRRKYGDNIADILDHLTKIQAELELIDNKDERLAQLEAEAQLRLGQVTEHAERLSAIRHNVAERLSQQIESELRELQMERTQFKVQLGRLEHKNPAAAEGSTLTRFNENGWDQAEFLISANPGEPLRSLHRIASGGELSRIMLALKSIFAKMERIPVLVFDEVDTGVSGRAAQSIAEKIVKLSRSCQVFSITHLPQVACMADAHYLIRKEVDGERTYTKMDHLQNQERIMELARMLGGVEVTETTEHHAQEMLIMAAKKKTSL